MPHQPFAADARFVTLSATYGAGGSVIGPLLARRLGLPFADRLIPARDKPVAPSGEGVDEEEAQGEPRRSFFARLANLNAALNLPAPRDPEDLRDHVRDRVEESIGALASDGGAVLLGRSGQIVLARHPGAFHVRLDGPPERRAHRGALWEGIDLRAARARLIETDEARARYTRRLYQHDPADPTLYHVVLDVTVLSAAVCVELVAAAAEAFWGNDDARLEETMRETRASLDSLTHNPVDGR
ncbi:MAG TPA: cytidylate kinase-like family protein [Acidimicrobiales bacterium]|nr:cytidylate kinase-like family protein [Acidimicrobiales bacterium]